MALIEEERVFIPSAFLHIKVRFRRPCEVGSAQCRGPPFQARMPHGRGRRRSTLVENQTGGWSLVARAYPSDGQRKATTTQTEWSDGWPGSSRPLTACRTTPAHGLSRGERSAGRPVVDLDTWSRKPCLHVAAEASQVPTLPTAFSRGSARGLSPHAYDMIRRDSLGKNYHLGPSSL